MVRERNCDLKHILICECLAFTLEMHIFTTNKSGSQEGNDKTTDVFIRAVINSADLTNVLGCRMHFEVEMYRFHVFRKVILFTGQPHDCEARFHALRILIITISLISRLVKTCMLQRNIFGNQHFESE